MRLDITRLPTVPLPKKLRLPKEPAIYFAIGRDGEVLYIGRSKSLAARWGMHHKRAELDRIGGVSLSWLAVDDAALLPKMERALIRRFRPRLNHIFKVGYDEQRWPSRKNFRRKSLRLDRDVVEQTEAKCARTGVSFQSVVGGLIHDFLEGKTPEMVALRRQLEAKHPTPSWFNAQS